MAIDGGIGAAIKLAIDGAKALRDTAKAWDEADFKLRIADLINTLTDAREKISDLSDQLRDRDREIADLKRAASERAALEYEAPFYWRATDGGRDGPFCQRCNDVDGKSVRLIDVNQGRWHCAGCKAVYAGPERARYVAEETAKLRSQREANRRNSWMAR